MYLYFLKDYSREGVLLYKKDETAFVKNEMLARYLIRMRIAVEPK